MTDILKQFYPELEPTLIKGELSVDIENLKNEVDVKIEGLKEEIAKVETIKGDKGDDGIDGEDYILTEDDKVEIASKIEVPVIERVIEKTQTVIKEVPIVTNQVIETAITDTADEIANKLNTLEERIEPKVIKGLEDKLDDFAKSFKKGGKNQLKLNDVAGAPLDQRWHGGGLTKVTHDTTLSGSGTPSDPLMVVGSGSGSVTSVATDTTLTGGPITTTGTLGLNLNHANTWLQAQTILKTGLGTSTADGWVLDNTTVATSGNPQSSPATRWRSRFWNTSSTTSQTMDFRVFNKGGTDGIVATGTWKLQGDRNSTGFYDVFSVDQDGQTIINATGYSLSSSNPTGLEIKMPVSNSNPGTDRHLRLSNQGGSNSYMDWTFSGVTKAMSGADVMGNMKYYANSEHMFYYGTNAFADRVLEVFSGGIATPYGMFAGGKVTAGGSVTSPSSYLQTFKSSGEKLVFIDTDTTLTDQYTNVIVGTTQAICTGNPTYACSHWTNSSDCTARDSHGGCTWNTTDCSIYAGDQTACQAQTGCTYDTSSCSVYNGDFSNCTGTSGCTWTGSASCGVFSSQSPCEAQSPCVWTEDSGNCTIFNGNTSGCVGQSGCSINASNTCPFFTDDASCSGGGCTPVDGGDCGTLSDGGGDGTLCATQPSCTYDSGSGVCSGVFFTSCDGDNSTCTGSYDPGTGVCSGTYDPMTCTGSYYTGSCSGSFGNCSGMSTCAPISNSFCASEAGCTASTGTVIQMPDDSGFTEFLRTYRIAKDGGSGQLTIITYTGQTFWNTSTTITTTTAYDNYILAFGKKTADCSTLGSGDCGSTTGCTASYNDCGSYSDDTACNADSHCSWNYSSSFCDGGSYFVSCSGTYVLSRVWYNFS